MVPVSNLLIFGGVGFALWQVRPRYGVSAGSLSPAFLPSFSFRRFAGLLTFRGLSLLACSVFSAGLAFRLTTWLLAKEHAPAQFVRPLARPAGFVALLAGFGPGREKLVAHRSLRRLPAPRTCFLSCSIPYAPKA